MDWNDLFSGTPLPGTFAGIGHGCASSRRGSTSSAVRTSAARRWSFSTRTWPSDQFQIDAAIEIQGHSSPTRWNSDKLSFQVKFKPLYGPTKLNYPFFAGSPDGDERDDRVRHADSRRGVQLLVDSREHGRPSELRAVRHGPGGGRPAEPGERRRRRAARQVRAPLSQRPVLGPVQRPRAARRLVRRGILRRQTRTTTTSSSTPTTTSTTNTPGSRAAWRPSRRIKRCSRRGREAT